ncbi:hypothetical protein BDZ94DRAFT_1250256 [Collybia nuda]|uniref:Uncharacterized protein n=1 Tax=Collybia nuda TaxID=64659 RepID=A0A9P6CM59_9AGAR|nr:hypothetical protein BDZ94DRAFT_1250256 [Collybia nuda]
MMIYSAPRNVAFPRARIALPEISPRPGTVEEVVVVLFDTTELDIDVASKENMDSLEGYFELCAWVSILSFG